MATMQRSGSGRPMVPRQPPNFKALALSDLTAVEQRTLETALLVVKIPFPILSEVLVRVAEEDAPIYTKSGNVEIVWIDREDLVDFGKLMKVLFSRAAGLATLKTGAKWERLYLESATTLAVRLADELEASGKIPRRVPSERERALRLRAVVASLRPGERRGLAHVDGGPYRLWKRREGLWLRDRRESGRPDRVTTQKLGWSEAKIVERLIEDGVLGAAEDFPNLSQKSP